MKTTIPGDNPPSFFVNLFVFPVVARVHRQALSMYAWGYRSREDLDIVTTTLAAVSSFV